MNERPATPRPVDLDASAVQLPPRHPDDDRSTAPNAHTAAVAPGATSERDDEGGQDAAAEAERASEAALRRWLAD